MAKWKRQQQRKCETWVARGEEEKRSRMTEKALGSFADLLRRLRDCTKTESFSEVFEQQQGSRFRRAAGDTIGRLQRVSMALLSNHTFQNHPSP